LKAEVEDTSGRAWGLRQQLNVVASKEVARGRKIVDGKAIVGVSSGCWSPQSDRWLSDLTGFRLCCSLA
jgi:hypothetical protein